MYKSARESHMFWIYFPEDFNNKRALATTKCIYMHIATAWKILYKKKELARINTIKTQCGPYLGWF